MPMPNLQTFARLLQIGNSPQLQVPSLPQGMVQPFRGLQANGPDFDVDAEINKIYQPRHSMQDMTEQMLQNFPQRNEHPSIWRRIGAALVGAGSDNPMAASDQFMNYHYYNQLRDFKNQFDPLSKAADDERLANAQMRQLAEQTVTRKQNQQKIEETERKNQATEKDKERMRANQEERTKLMVFKANNPNIKLVTSIKGGNIFTFNPLSGQLQDTGIDSGTLSDVDKIATQLESNLEQIRERGSQSRSTQAAGISQRGEESRKTQGEGIAQREENIRTRPPTVSGGGSKTVELEKSRAMSNRAKEAALTPEWAKYITFGPNNTFKVQEPGRFSGPDAKTYEAITSYIRGGAGSSTKPSTNKVAPQSSGKVRVQSPDGKVGTIDASELKDALAAGWKKIGG